MMTQTSLRRAKMMLLQKAIESQVGVIARMEQAVAAEKDTMARYQEELASLGSLGDQDKLDSLRTTLGL